MESINHYPNWLKTITIEIDKFLINREYFDFFMQMYMQWSKDGGSTSSFQNLIIPCLPCFEKLALSQFKLYIETETITQFCVCFNSKNTILIWSAEVKEGFLILHMLRIHTGLRKLSKKNVYDLHLLKKNIFDIGKPCIKIANRELVFYKYWMARNRDKYDIEVRYDDAIKCKQNILWFHVMSVQSSGWIIYGYNLILIKTIKNINWGNKVQRKLKYQTLKNITETNKK